LLLPNDIDREPTNTAIVVGHQMGALWVGAAIRYDI
jgi:hypothetical protein